MKRILTLLILFVAVSAWGQKSDFVDDLLQHAPMGSVFVLKACEFESASASWEELALTAGCSYVLAAATTYSMKQIVRERRPDKSDRRSFPSGHATFAFAGASTLSHEFGHLSPWVTIGGYGVATLTAVHRVMLDRHYLHDVCAGAAIGWLSSELTYYLKQRFIKSKNIDVNVSGHSIDVAIRL
ncbi:MAG: phosphatase PAP2 family protein [Prevotella sp.]|nr:phosphatase PAP2 family protein [Prevotella sp.]